MTEIKFDADITPTSYKYFPRKIETIPCRYAVKIKGEFYMFLDGWGCDQGFILKDKQVVMMQIHGKHITIFPYGTLVDGVYWAEETVNLREIKGFDDISRDKVIKHL